MIETYTLKDMAIREKLDTQTVKRRYNYIPLKIVTWQTKANFRAWHSTRDYTIKYVKLDDILDMLKDEIDFTFVRKKTK